MDSLGLFSICQHHIETPGHGNHELMQSLVSVSSPGCPPGYVIKVVGSLDREGNMATFLDERQIPSRIINNGQINQFAFFQHDGHSIFGHDKSWPALFVSIFASPRPVLLCDFCVVASFALFRLRPNNQAMDSSEVASEPAKYACMCLHKRMSNPARPLV